MAEVRMTGVRSTLCCVIAVTIAILPIRGVLAAEGQSLFDRATEAYDRGDLGEAASLFEQAALQEEDAQQRALNHVWTANALFFAGNAKGAREALLRALADDPQMVLRPEFWGADFIELFSRTKRELQPSAPGSDTRSTATALTLAVSNPAVEELRRRAAVAADTTTLGSLLTPLRQVEVSDPTATMDVLQLRCEILERLGRRYEALEDRGRLEALRAATLAIPGTSPLPLETLLEARKMLREGQAREAASLLRGVLRAQPSSVQALEAYSEALMKSGQLDEAYETLRIALVTNENAELRIRQGEIEIARDRVGSARQAFARAAEVDGSNDRAQAALGLTAARLGDIATARTALSRAVELNSLLFAARVVRAQIALVDNDPDLAIDLLKAALELQPDDPWASGWLGAAYLQLGQLDAAVDRLTVSESLGDSQLRLFQAEALRRLGRVSESLSLLKGEPGVDLEARLLEARCLLQIGSLDEAAEILAGLASARPEDGRVQYLVGFTAHLSGQWEKADHHLEQARALSGAPTFIDEALATTRRSSAAQSLLDQAAEPPPTSTGR